MIDNPSGSAVHPLYKSIMPMTDDRFKLAEYEHAGEARVVKELCKR